MLIAEVLKAILHKRQADNLGQATVRWRRREQGFVQRRLGRSAHVRRRGESLPGDRRHQLRGEAVRLQGAAERIHESVPLRGLD